MLPYNILNTYSNLHGIVKYENSNLPSFEGSQIQYEFFEAWNRISEYFSDKEISEISFLEIGSWKGLWGIALCEYCKLKNIKGSYVSVTLLEKDQKNLHLYKTFEYLESNGITTKLINGNSLSSETVDIVKKINKPFNIVLIDGSHEYESVISDIKNYSGLTADILLFHDIRPKIANKACGVYQAIIDYDIKLDDEITVNENIMGIGIKYVNSNTQS